MTVPSPKPKMSKMSDPDASTSSILLDLANLSITSRNSRSRSDHSINEPDFSSAFAAFRTWVSPKKNKKKDSEPREHEQSDVTSQGDDIEVLKKDLHHERKLLRRALLELAELRIERDELDGQRLKATSDLRKLRQEDQKNQEKITKYRSRIEDQEVALEEVRTNVETLRLEGEEKEEKITSTKYKLRKARDKLQGKRAEISRLNEALSELQTQGHPSSENLDTIDSLGRDLSASKEEIKTLKADNTSLDKDCTRLRADREATCQRLIRVEAQAAIQTYEMKDLTKAKLDLENMRDLVRPILQIGVDIRLRNLEAAREPLLNIKHTEKDRAIMLSGNIAAHRGNGAVDAALFFARLVPKDYLPAATKIFTKLYQVSPRNYGCWSPMVLRLIDCQATIATIQVQQHFEKIDTSHLRKEHTRLHNLLMSRHKRLSAGDFEADKKARALLTRIEEIMEEIVDKSRGKSRGRKVFRAFVYEDSGSEVKRVERQRGREKKAEADDSSQADDDSSEDSDLSNGDDTTEEERTDEHQSTETETDDSDGSESADESDSE